MRQWVVDSGAAPDELTQPTHLGMAIGHRIIRQVRRGQPQIERAGLRNLNGALNRSRPTCKPPHLLSRRAKMREWRSRQPSVCLVKRSACPDCAECCRQRALCSSCIVNVVCCHNVHSRSECNVRKCIVAMSIEWIIVIPELHEDAVTPKRRREDVEFAAGSCRPVSHECCRYRPLTTSSQDEPGIIVCCSISSCSISIGDDEQAPRDAAPRVARSQWGAPFFAAELRLTDRTCQARVSDRTLRQHEQMPSWWIRCPWLRGAAVERHLRTEDRRQTEGTRRLSETHDAVEAIVISHR